MCIACAVELSFKKSVTMCSFSLFAFLSRFIIMNNRLFCILKRAKENTSTFSYSIYVGRICVNCTSRCTCSLIQCHFLIIYTCVNKSNWNDCSCCTLRICCIAKKQSAILSSSISYSWLLLILTLFPTCSKYTKAFISKSLTRSKSS